MMRFERGYTLEEGLESVGKGWSTLIKIAFAFKPKEVKVVQVKEKFGGLRIYTKGSSDEYYDLIDLLESASYRTCEWCGKKGTLDTRYWWVLTLCEQCKRKRKREKGPNEIQPVSAKSKI